MIDADDVTKFRSTFPQFVQRMGDEALNAMLSSTVRAEFLPGRNLVRDRMPVDGIYFVLDGEASVFVEEGERSVLLGTIKPGQFLGEVSVLSGTMMASSTVQAATRMRTLKLRHQDTEAMLLSPTVGPQLLDLMVDTLKDRLSPAKAA